MGNDLSGFAGGVSFIRNGWDTLSHFVLLTFSICHGRHNGHGFINPEEQASNWPALYLEQQGDKTNLELASIYQMLIAKKPRLLLVSADTCSSFSTDAHVPKLVPVGRGEEDRSAQQYTQLFVVSQGAYIASGSQKGLPTWTGPNGSYYTMVMRAEVYNTAHRAGTDKASWEAIFGAVCGKDLVAGVNLPSNTPLAERSQFARFEKNPVIQTPAR